MSGPKDVVTAQVSATIGWWRALTSESEKSLADTGGRARLRRATPESALIEEQTIALMRALRRARKHTGAPPDDTRDTRMAIRLALVLAHVREDDRKPFGRSIGRQSSDNNSEVIKPIRFRRLIECETEDDIVTMFRRALAMVDRRVSIGDLARHLLTFGTEAQRRRLILQYYNAFDANPAEDAEPTTLAVVAG